MDHMDAYLTMIPKDEEDLAKAVNALHSWHVCNMCILRFLGDTVQDSYRRTADEQQNWMKQYLTCDDDTNGGSNEKDSVCVACVGILQDMYCSQAYYKKLHDIVKKEDFQFDSYYLSLSIPVPLLLREYAVFLKLMELLPQVYDMSVREDITPIKEVWKWASGPSMSHLLAAPFDQKSLFEVKLNFSHSELEKECNFLLDLFPNVFCHRKNNKRHCLETFTRVNVPNALDTMSEATFMKNYTCPPRQLSISCECTSVVCTHEAIYIAGRYNKYSRDLSQTPWIVDGGRRTESSIEEMLCTKLKLATRCDSYKMSASGREDVDVLMLGRGRPFLVEIINPRKIHFTADEMKTFQDEINSTHKEIRSRDLQVVTKEETKNLKAGEEDKVKVYSALCWAENPMTQEFLDFKLNPLKDLVLKQKTPVRVLHRRALAVRDRTIHKISAKRRDEKHFFIYLSSQAGTYIKEFVHGDFGRTRPCLGHILDTECDILELNVDSVELDWPRQLEPYDPDEDQLTETI